MDITNLVVTRRENALLLGDYNAYRASLSRQLLTLRKRLGRTTPKNAKYSPKEPVTPKDVGKNNEYVFIQLFIFTAERAWAHAMHMKSTHTEDNADKGITGSTRQHIISRLHKASNHAKELSKLLSDQVESGANDIDVLEAQAYVYSLVGAEEFEQQAEGMKTNLSTPPEERWRKCLTNFSAARVIYNALLRSTKKDIFKEILAGTIDPSIRYAAYQSRLPRSLAVSAIARQNFPRDNASLVSFVEKVSPDALEDETTTVENKGQGSTETVPSTISWRSRTANIADASVSQALAAVLSAEVRLSSFLQTASPNTPSKEKAAAYDEVLIASQDCADATRHAIEELEKEGVNEGDFRMQDLRVTSLAVSYALIGWRVGRNRVLIGHDDGMVLEEAPVRKPKRTGRVAKQWIEKEEGNSRKLARLRERVVLYDSTMQSIDSVKELRGAMRDAGFVDELESQRAYFQALKCLNIAYSHALLSNPKNALALFARGLECSTASLSQLSAVSEASFPPKLSVTGEQARALHRHLQGLVSQFRALVDLRTSSADSAMATKRRLFSAAPMVERLEEYPNEGVDLSRLVQWPPKVQPVPVKPLFLDVAWNYIDYPGRTPTVVEAEDMMDVDGGVQAEEQQPKKKGWFGFGR
ncbi:signal recognition particle [Saccharata proteae CBS 121410]|uniref:Signal recognition particle subunit SRP68 n=1 Tax=Saccharata proteae CBS 121410 TaxID=1314787 RepID=A0A6A5YDS5_9PEZI|nr:signal recognition particle [Saccharata proteae CBS 121410]